MVYSKKLDLPVRMQQCTGRFLQVDKPERVICRLSGHLEALIRAGYRGWIMITPMQAFTGGYHPQAEIVHFSLHSIGLVRLVIALHVPGELFHFSTEISTPLFHQDLHI